jgi:hypothetical protein
MESEEYQRLVRGADVIAGPDGAAFYNCLFARPGTRVGMLSQPSLEGYEWWNQAFTDLGLRVVVLPWERAAEGGSYRYQSDFSIDVGMLPTLIEPLD